MVAPLDSRATFVAGGETINLVMNFRTIALAESEVPNAIAGGGGTLSGMAVLVWAFAQPAHPDLTLDQAAMLCLEHGPEVGAALAQVIARGGAKGDGTARPPKAGRSKS